MLFRNSMLYFCLILSVLLANCTKETGCTDPLSSNYNPDAEMDDGSCTYLGCTDPTAENYDPNANLSNGNCIYKGCTDPIAENYDPNASVDDGNCIYATVAERLDRGEKPFDIIDLGFPLDSLYKKSYAGGLIFYLDVSTRKGLVAAPSDIVGDMKWGCEGTEIMNGNGANGINIGDGQANTDAILTDCNEAGIAAKVCDEAIINGKNDWYLPSINELVQMYAKIQNIEGALSGSYWTSTQAEFDPFNTSWNADAATVVDGSQFYFEARKQFTYKVRPIRAF